MTYLTATEISDIVRSLYADVQTCDWCDEPITSDEPGEPCSGRDGPIHPACHAESGCRRVE